MFPTSIHSSPPLTAGVGVLLLLAFASALVFLLKPRLSEKEYSELKARIATWWRMSIIFLLAILLVRSVSIAFFALLSFLALKEYVSLIPTRRSDRRVLLWAYLAIPLQYFWVWYEWYGMFIIFIPVYMFLFLPVRMVLVGDTAGFLRAAGTLHWGLMTTVFSLSHVAFLLVLPADEAMTAGAGLVLFLVILTEMSDVMQFVWGKTLGKHKILPLVSPNKTWEGFLGGVVSTILLALLLGPYLTPLSLLHSAVAGCIIAFAGFAGDVTVSALKRDLKIKDTGSALPGHGGILDRVDSLTYTAPLFFHFVHYFYY